MIKKIAKLVLNPGKYLCLAIRMLQQKMCSLFQNTSFFMQGQMDINPKSRWHNDAFSVSTGGYYPKNDPTNRQICNLEPWDNTRRDMLVLLLRTIAEKNIVGDIAEIGVYKGSTAKLIHHYMPERKLHLFDTFEGFTDRSVVAEKENTDYSIFESHFSDTSLERVKACISQKNSNVLYYKGYFPESIPEDLHQLKFAFVHLDADLYEPTLEGLKFFYPRMNTRGLIVVHDYNAWPGARKAVDDFFSDKNELPLPMPDKSGSVLIVKQ
ncbi:MAG: TylF/MycF/NovP-related O-methyltransferase [Victivallaceae bacterium]|jgi:O-methyltransferase